jgi:hypothetical protein
MRASQRPRAKYPPAIVSAYGPNNARATKLVDGILRRAGQENTDPMRSWSSDAIDVRHDSVIAAESADWLGSQGIKETDTYDRIIGCPHVETDGHGHVRHGRSPGASPFASLIRKSL